MPRRVEDILPNNRRSIKDVLSGHSSQKPHSADSTEVPVKRVSTIAPSPNVKMARPKPTDRRKKIFKILLSLGGTLATIGLISFLASTYLSRAVFTITPKKIPIAVDGNYVALNAPKDGLLSYGLLKSDAVESATVPTVDLTVPSTKAYGMINVFNAYSYDPRRLIAGTRFSNANGKIYRLTSTVIIPGYKSANGVIAPGVVKTAVTADQPGADYNMTVASFPRDLKIVAYADTDKYQKIYGQVSSDVGGGGSGVKKSVDPAVLASTTAMLRSRLATTLASQIMNKVPVGYVMFNNSVFPYFSNPEISAAAQNQAVITLRSTMYGIVFKRDELISKLAKRSVSDIFGGLPYDVVGFDRVSFAVSNQKDFSPEKANALIVQLKGNIELIGKIPIDELKKKISNLRLADTEQVVRSYSPIIELEKSSGQVVPPWAKIPANPDKISIIIK